MLLEFFAVQLREKLLGTRRYFRIPEYRALFKLIKKKIPVNLCFGITIMFVHCVAYLIRSYTVI